jgi:hypothetical protein
MLFSGVLKHFFSRRIVFHDGIPCARGYIGRPRNRWKVTLSISVSVVSVKMESEFNSETEQAVERPLFMKKKPLDEHCLTCGTLSVYHRNNFWLFSLLCSREYMSFM